MNPQKTIMLLRSLRYPPHLKSPQMRLQMIPSKNSLLTPPFNIREDIKLQQISSREKKLYLEKSFLKTILMPHHEGLIQSRLLSTSLLFLFLKHSSFLLKGGKILFSKILLLQQVDFFSNKLFYLLLFDHELVVQNSDNLFALCQILQSLIKFLVHILHIFKKLLIFDRFDRDHLLMINYFWLKAFYDTDLCYYCRLTFLK